VDAGGAAPPSEVSRLERLTPLEFDVALAAGAGTRLDAVAHRLFLGPRTARLLQASAMAKFGVDSTAELVAASAPSAHLPPDPAVMLRPDVEWRRRRAARAPATWRRTGVRRAPPP